MLKYAKVEQQQATWRLLVGSIISKLFELNYCIANKFIYFYQNS